MKCKNSTPFPLQLPVRAAAAAVNDDVEMDVDGPSSTAAAAEGGKADGKDKAAVTAVPFPDPVVQVRERREIILPLFFMYLLFYSYCLLI